MQTYVKIDEKYWQVFVQVSEGKLWLRSSRGIKKGFVRQIDLQKMEDLFTFEILGNQQIHFVYEGESYFFYDSGLGLREYLSTNLFVK